MWSDGTPFTADDVVFTFEVNFDRNIAAPGGDLFTQSDGSFPTIQKVDEHTVMFQLKEPNAAFAAAIGSTYLIPKHKWENALQSRQLPPGLNALDSPARRGRAGSVSHPVFYNRRATRA